MECPDIHKFLTNKRHRSHVRAGKIGDPVFKDTVRSDLLRLGGVTGLCLVLPPSSEQPPDRLASHLTSLLEDDTSYYEVRDFCPAVMFSKEFLLNFVNTGTLNILSQNDREFALSYSLDSYAYMLHHASCLPFLLAVFLIKTIINL